MLANPRSTPTQFGPTSPIGVARQSERPSSGRDEVIKSSTEKQPLWIPMLQSASKGKDLSEKNLIILGGTSDLQREYLEQLYPETQQRHSARSNDRRRQKQVIPVSNKFALGYTYHDVLDADQEDVLARLHVYMLTNPSGRFSSLLQTLLTESTVQDTVITILLDWSDPFVWARQLRQWIRLLRKVILSLDDTTKIAMEEHMNAWKEKRLGPDAQSSSQPESLPPSGPGEWDEGLGVPLSVVCVQSEKMERLDRDLGWGDDQYDFLQQWLRTVLLKHGASLVYTASFEPNNIRPLLHTSLNIESLLKREIVKQNILDRDKILVPPNWDSWAKIRILKENFDPETVSTTWSIEIQEQPEDLPDFALPTQTTSEPSSSPPSSAVELFELALPNPIAPSTTYTDTTPEITITATPLQDFLQQQLPILERLKAEDEAAAEKAKRESNRNTVTSPINSSDDPRQPHTSSSQSRSLSPLKASSNLIYTDSIGAHRVNVNGIDLDAEEATRRIRERETERNALRRGMSETNPPNPSTTATASSHVLSSSMTSGAASPAKTMSRQEGSMTPGGEGKPSNEALHGFFANLIKKGEQGRNRSGGGSGAVSPSPRRESPAPAMRRQD